MEGSEVTLYVHEWPTDPKVDADLRRVFAANDYDLEARDVEFTVYGDDAAGSEKKLLCLQDYEVSGGSDAFTVGFFEDGEWKESIVDALERHQIGYELFDSGNTANWEPHFIEFRPGGERFRAPSIGGEPAVSRDVVLEWFVETESGADIVQALSVALNIDDDMVNEARARAAAAEEATA